MPVPLSAPGVNRTPDLQVRSLTEVVALLCSTHFSPVTTRSPRCVQTCDLGSHVLRVGTVRAQLGGDQRDDAFSGPHKHPGY